MDVFDLVATLSLDSSEYDKGLENAEGEASSFGGALSALGGVAGGLGIAFGTATTAIAAVGTATYETGKALWDATSGVAEYGDHIDKMSQKMGISAEAYQEWDAVLQHSGTSIESLKTSMKTLATAAEQGDEAFEQLGITQEQIASMSSEELFSTVITNLQELGEGTERTYLASQLLGRGATELGALLNTSAEETQAMKDRVHELGGVMSDEAVKNAAQFQDNLQDLQTSIEGVKRGILTELLPSFNDLMDGFTKLISGEEGADDALISGLDKLIDGAGNIADRVFNIGMEVLPRLITGISERIPDFINALATSATLIGPALIDSLTNDVFPMLMQTLPGIIESYMEVLPELMQSSFDMAATWMPMIIDLVFQLFATFSEAFAEMYPIMVPLAIDMMTYLVNAILSNLPLLLDAAAALISGMAQGIISSIPALISAAIQIVMQLVATIIEMVPHMISAAVRLVTDFVTSLVTTFLQFLSGDYWASMLDGIIKSFTDIDWAGIGKMLTQGIADGIKNGFSKIKDAATNVADGIKNIFTSLFDIHSPSKLFEYYGEMIDEGLAIGIASGASVESTKDLSNNISNSFSPNPQGSESDKVINIFFGNELFRSVVIDALSDEVYVSGGR